MKKAIEEANGARLGDKVLTVNESLKYKNRGPRDFKRGDRNFEEREPRRGYQNGPSYNDYRRDDRRYNRRDGPREYGRDEYRRREDRYNENSSEYKQGDRETNDRRYNDSRREPNEYRDNYRDRRRNRAPNRDFVAKRDYEDFKEEGVSRKDNRDRYNRPYKYENNRDDYRDRSRDNGYNRNRDRDSYNSNNNLNMGSREKQRDYNRQKESSLSKFENRKSNPANDSYEKHRNNKWDTDLSKVNETFKEDRANVANSWNPDQAANE